jgi:hypothetical protein
MPLFFLLAGLILVVTGINGTTATAGELLKRDFTGPNNFFTWFFAILFVGALGYVPTLKPLSIAFMVLLFISIFLSSGSGFFDKLQEVMRKYNASGVSSSGSAGGGFQLPDVDFDFGGMGRDDEYTDRDGETYSI